MQFTCDFDAGGRAGSMAAALAVPSVRMLGPSSSSVDGLHNGTSPPARGRSTKKNGGDQALGRSRGGLSTKIHAATMEVSEVLCLGPVYYSSFSSDLPRRGSAPQFPPSRGVMGARSPHSEGISLIC